MCVYYYKYSIACSSLDQVCQHWHTIINIWNAFIQHTHNNTNCFTIFQVISEHREGPYPMLIEPPDGGFWLQHGEHDSARGTDGVWTAPEIDTEHYTIQTDKTAFVYGRYFMWRVRTTLTLTLTAIMLLFTVCALRYNYYILGIALSVLCIIIHITIF